MIHRCQGKAARLWPHLGLAPEERQRIAGGVSWLAPEERQRIAGGVSRRLSAFRGMNPEGVTAVCRPSGAGITEGRIPWADAQ